LLVKREAMSELRDILHVRVDADELRERAISAMKRARVAVQPVPVTGRPRCFTLSTEAQPSSEAGFTQTQAEHYAAAVNGEAVLARGMVLLLAELDKLRLELDDLRGGDGRTSQVTPVAKVIASEDPPEAVGFF
jgi:hypothetical protein